MKESNIENYDPKRERFWRAILAVIGIAASLAFFLYLMHNTTKT